ncbi:MAG: tetratricopeptide repeat protein [Xanthobacteraceae bacterium]|nr:tetratricopeptide repeat protein [Xanthobacteraceae bacterium]
MVEAIEHYGAGRPAQAAALCGAILTAHPGHVPALHLAAVIAFATGRAAEGTALLGRVFALDPDHAPALATLGDALAVKGEREGSLAAFQCAVMRRPRDAGLHAKLGTALCDLSRFDEAEAAYRRALELDSGLTRARFNLAVALTGQGRLAEAEDAYRAVVACDPAHHGAWLNLGHVLADQEKLDDAVAAYRRALTADPIDPALHRRLGDTLRRLGRIEDAVMHCRRATQLAPNSVAAFCSLGLALHQAGRPIEAAQAYRQASVLDPGDPVILRDLGARLCELGQLDEAVTACERALALNPDHAPAHTNLGVILEMQDDIEAAVAAHRRAIAADPGYAKGHANLAVALRSAGRIDQALAASHRAVALDPDQPLARYNHAHFLLMNGDLEQGFREFRWGRKCKIWSEGYPTFSEPEWQGEALAGRTLLLFAEAGLGDVLQFVRYLPMVAAMGGSIVLQVQPALVSLLRMSCGVTVVGRGEPLPPFDLQLPLMDLPRLFGTTLDTIPAAVPYLHADPATLARWRRALQDVEALKVGVAWAGNPRHKGDRQRSLSAEAVLPRLVMPGVQLYSLQKEPGAADVPVLARLGTDIVDLAPALGDFADTAAAVAALDLVIVVDTSVAHLAGALGRPVWVLLPYALDWRWLRDREDSPWYPGMRLFRQHKPQAWEGVMARASAELARVAAGSVPSAAPARPKTFIANSTMSVTPPVPAASAGTR